jgi:catechol 2,3-dioxygenase-like lactoylglutathione lyase family enzyme
MRFRTIAFMMGCAALALAPPKLAGVYASEGRLAGESRPPIVGVSHVAVQTRDLAKARAFYSGLLGYPEVPLAGRPHAAVFAVNDRQRLIVHDGLPADRDERLLDVAFETTNVEAMREFLNARGAPVTEPIHDAEAGGRRVEAVDPDGHRVQFVQPDRDARTTPAAGPDRRVSRRILHAGLTIRDVAAADRFYKGMLTFSEIWRGGRTDDVTSWINMRAPEGTEYLEYMLEPGAVDRRQLGSAHHVALVVPDMQEALALVRSRMTPQDLNAAANPQIGRNRKWQLNLYDPDGTRIELMEPWPTVR